MHVDASTGWRQSKISALRVKLDLDPLGEVNIIYNQVLIYLIAIKFCDIWVEIHADPSLKLGPLLSLSSATALPLLVPPQHRICLPLSSLKKKKE